jgi:hypothetical protein
MKRLAVGCLAPMALWTAGCGEFISQDRSGVVVMVESLQGASGAQPDDFGGTVGSDVITVVKRTINGQQVDIPTVFNDLGRVTLSLVLKDPGQPGVSNVPSPINQVTFTRYHVEYRRADGRNRPGVDVPYPFDGAATFSVPKEGSVTASFELVRVVAKEEAPLAALRSSDVFLTTLAEVTFFGHDQAGNAVTAKGSLSVTFGNWGDPQ